MNGPANSTATDLAALAQAGAAALRAGDPAGARQHFEKIVESGQADSSVWVAIAMTHRHQQDHAAARRTVDRALELDPRNLRALVMKGDDLSRTGDLRTAVAFYGLAAELGARVPNLPGEVAKAVQRAAAERERINRQIYEHLHGKLVEAGYDERTSSSRFTHSLDLLTGRKQRYIQQPRAYLFPELPETQFYPREIFPWLDPIEAATADIRAELESVLAQGGNFVPYIQSGGAGPARPEHNLLDSQDWSAFFLVKDGKTVSENAALCPRTMAALEHAPLARIPGRTPSVLFSALRPGAHIVPHTGFVNARLICHLPIVVPPGCYLRVGNDQREWQQGKAWVFDDTIEHEARNTSGQTRIVLIFDIWRPELTEEERGLVSALMQAVDTFPGPSLGSWSA